MTRDAAVARWRKVRCLLSCIRTFTQHDDGGLKAISHTATVQPFAPSTWSTYKQRLFQRAYDKIREYRTDADLKILMELVQSLTIFAHLSYASKIYVCWSLQCTTLHDGEVVYHQGERITPFSSVYFVLEGVISIYQNGSLDSVQIETGTDEETFDVAKLGDCIKTVTVGQYFGEAALQGIVLRQYTVLAQSRAKIAKITQEEYRQILEHDNARFNAAEFLYPVQCEPHKRAPDDIAKLCALLSTFQLFRSLPLPLVEKLSGRLIIQTYNPNDAILLQEDTLSKFIVIVSGRVQMHIANTTEMNKSEQETEIGDADANDAEALFGPAICELTHGEFFGEQAFEQKYGAVQSGTLRAISPVATIVLMRSDYDQILQEEEWLNYDIDRTSAEEEAKLSHMLALAPHERSELHVRNTIASLLKCDARVFFSQFSSRAMRIIAQYSTIRTANAGTVLLEQNQSSDAMFVLISGSVNIHRLTTRKKNRKESDTIRMKLHGLVETSIGYGADIYEKFGQFLSSFGPGGTFGHVPILTKSHSQSTYIVSRNLNKGIVMGTVLVIPSHFVKDLLQHQDEVILYNPRMIIENASLKPKDTMNATLDKLANYLSHHEIFCGLPTPTILRLLHGMEVVDIKNNQLLWEEHEHVANSVIVVLAGTLLLVHSGRKLAPIGSPTIRECEQRLCAFNPNRTAEKITRMNSTDTAMTLSLGDCVGTLKISKDEWYTMQSHSAIALCDGKVGILQWSKAQSPLPSLLKLAEDIIHLRQLQIRDEIERATINRLPIPTPSKYGTEDIKKLTAQLLIITGLKDKFPVPIQSHVNQALRFSSYIANETIFKQGEEEQALYIVLSGTIELFVLRKPIYMRGRKKIVPLKTQKSWRSRSQRKFDSSQRDPVRALLQLSNKSTISSVVQDKGFDSTFDATREGIGQVEAVLGPGDVLGESSLFTPGITYLSTAVAATPVVLLKLHRDTYEDLVRKGNQGGSTTMSARNQSERAREHWKLAVQLVLKKRSQRSQWPCVIEFAKQKRIRLVMDLIKDVPSFANMTSEVRQKICERTLFQTFAANTYVFGKGKAIERFYVIISGSVDLIQSSGNGVVDSNIAPLAASTSDASELVGYTKVRTVSDGEWFGEYEILAGKDSRLISAVTPNGVRLVAVNKHEFLQSWPTKSAMLSRMGFLNSIDSLRNLDDDRFCSLWYGLSCKVYRLNDTIIPYPPKSKAGMDDALYLLEDGQCTLRHQIPITRGIKCKIWKEPDVELETQIALLERGCALLCEETTWRTQRLVASTHLVRILQLHYPGMPYMIQRILGKRGVGCIRKLMRLQFEWQELQEQAATHLAVTAHPKPSDAAILPCIKCVPTATIQGNRMALPRFLLHRELNPSMTMEVKVDGPRLPTIPPKETKRNRPILGSFLFKSKTIEQSELSPLLGPVMALPAKSPDDIKIMRLERQLDDQIQNENQLAHALDHTERLKIQRQAAMDAKLRLKHGRPPPVATDQNVQEKRPMDNRKLRVFKAVLSTSTRTW